MAAFLIGLFFIIFSYLAGSVPFGLLVAKYFRIGDIREKGSKNIGATNVMRLGGRKAGAITLLLDVLKGFVPVVMSGYFCSPWVVSLCALAAVLGHIFPVWLKFKGGKGVATTIAVFAAVYWPLAVFAVFCWAAVFAISRISSLSSLCMMVFSCVVAVFYTSASFTFVVAIISALVIYRHKENIIRLLKGQEFSV